MICYNPACRAKDSLVEATLPAEAELGLWVLRCSTCGFYQNHANDAEAKERDNPI